MIAEASNEQAPAQYEIDGQIVSAEELAQMRAEQVNGLYSQFASMRDRWVQHRAQTGVEQRWQEATDLYYGDQDKRLSQFVDTLTNGPAKSSKNQVPRSRVVINIVRPKVDQAIARFCEILFPVDDQNWGIRPTPIPNIAGHLGNHTETVDPTTGQPTGMTADDEATALVQAAKEAAESMQKQIADVLTECQYNGESRKIIEDGVRLGTGIIKGPFPARRIKKSWSHDASGTSMVIKQETKPVSMRVDPWDVFFDPACGSEHQRGRGVWQRRHVTRKELRPLAGIDGYDAEAIRAVLKEQPKRAQTANSRIKLQVIEDDSYELWEYHGVIEPEEMECLSGQCGDPLKDVQFGVLVMVNDRIIGAMPSWVDDETVPYDVWTYRKSDDSPFGYGLPDELSHQQSVITSAWRQVMDNARTSMGGQIVMRKGAIIPENGSYVLSPNKVWFANADVPDVTHAFTTFEFASHVEELLAVAQAAMQFADMESGIPQLMGGEQGSAPETVGGMVMLHNNANATLRQRVKLYDDCITRPHIGRHYDFQMANSPNQAIKGDFDIDARGSSSLLERDIQNQALINLANITSNPRYSPMMREREELKAILKGFHLNPEDLMKTADQVAKDQANAQPQQDPRIVSAQMTLEAKKMEIADNKEQRQFDLQRYGQEDTFKKQQLQYNAQREQAEFEIAQTDSSIKRDTALLRENNSMTISREANAAKERLGVLNIETKRQLFNAEASLKINQGSGI